MDPGFWLGIAIGGIVSLVASIVANIYNAKIVAFLDKRKFVSHEKRRSKAISLDQTIRSLQSGERDKYLYLLQLTVGRAVGQICVVALLTGSVCVLAMVAQHAPLLGGPEPIKALYYAKLTLAIILYFFGLVFFFIGFRQGQRYNQISNALENFASYDAWFQEQWGDKSGKSIEGLRGR